MTGTRREPWLGPLGASDWLRGSSRLLRLRPHWARGAASGTSKRVLLSLRLSLAGGSPESARRERGDAGAARDPSSFPEQPPGSAPLPAPPRSPGTCYGHVYTRGKSKCGKAFACSNCSKFSLWLLRVRGPGETVAAGLQLQLLLALSTFLGLILSKLLKPRRCLCKKMIC